MKAVLFCQNPYAFGIMAPLRDELHREGHTLLWYIPVRLLGLFPFREDPYTTRILDLQAYSGDAIFVPGNEVPHYLRGVKVQIFHGLAGEKKGHFRIRHYFDLYLTQGPYFTGRFEDLRDKYRNFEVVETGWPKLDIYRSESLLDSCRKQREQYLQESGADRILLYAPTFSPSLTSAPFLLDNIRALASDRAYLVLIKFHDLMDPVWVSRYLNESESLPNLRVIADKNIVPYLILSDLLISDTSSVIYEFILLDKPVVSFRSIAENILWENTGEYGRLQELVGRNLGADPFAGQRATIRAAFHPYVDGQSARRVVEATQEYIDRNGVPMRRELSLLRQLKIRHIFGPSVPNPYGGPHKVPITALLITYNEILHIEQVLENLKFADEIIVVDSFSTDGTVEVASTYPGVTFIQRPFKNYTDQKTFALSQASNDWVLFTDADERIPDTLLDEIFRAVNQPREEVTAYFFRRLFMFRDKKLRFSGWQTDKNIRLFRKSRCQFTQNRIVHETLEVSGKSEMLHNKLVHYSYRSYADYRRKMIQYGKMKALEEFRYGKRFHPVTAVLRTVYKFLNHFILRLGFLDGQRGVIISYLNALGVYSRYLELKRLGNPPSAS